MAFLRNKIATLLSAVVSVSLAPAARPQSNPPDQQARVQKIESQAVDVSWAPNQPPLQLTLQQVMDAFRVPGMSMAVIDDFRIAWAKAYGVTDAGSNKPVTTKTLFQAGSISKPVAATGALFLVEQGKLSLDEDVNVKLKTWKVPENEFTKNEKVTLRRLLSHTAGLTVHGFPGYDVDDPLPTLVQIFNGEKPANTEPIRVDTIPGTLQRYSGGGVTIEQQLMIDVTGEPFPVFMRANVLQKIGMTDSSYSQPLPADWAARTAAGTRPNGNIVHGRSHVYPEMAAAGLWTTPTDLSKFAIEIALSKQSKANHVLSEKMVATMLTPVKDQAGLGFFIEKDDPDQFGHNGADEGFQAILTMNSKTGKGVAVMANSDRGIAAAQFLVHAVAKEYGWTFQPPLDPSFTLLLVAKLRGTPAVLDCYSTWKRTTLKENPVDEGTLNELGYLLLQDGRTQDAVAVFQRNVQEYPQSSNVYDSLGEAYMNAGQKDLAIANYEKSLQLNPNNRHGAEILKQLRATP
jgi:CubicO group peptidase (beta-lactamase class C family)